MEPGVRNLFHVDIITICGGTKKDGRENFIETYLNQKKSVDVVINFGLNDLKRMDAPDFKKEMTEWVCAIEYH